MARTGYWGMQECFNRELVRIVEWSEIESVGHQFLPCSPSVKNSRSELGERTREETKIFHFSHSFIKKELENFRQYSAKIYKQLFFIR